MIKNILYLSQIITGILLGVLIILQSKGSGLGSSFGSNISFYATRRGAEKLIFILTIIVSVIFLTLSLLGAIF